MTKSIKTVSFAKDQPAEILSDERHIRLVRLDFYHDTYGGTHEYLAQLGEGMVKLIHMSDDAKPKIAHIDPNNMTRLAIAWLAFMDDCKAAEDKEQAKYQAEIDTVKLRAIAVGAVMTDYNPGSNYGTFNLSWPMGHALERYNRHWTYGNENLALDDVQDRLKTVEKHVEEAQTEAVENPRHISDYEQQVRRAHEIDAELMRSSSDGREHDGYRLIFKAGHPFARFWNIETGLTPGQVEYRLNYVEGVMQQQALQK